MLKTFTRIILVSLLIAPVYAIDEQMILEQLETLGKKDLAFPIAYQLALKQDNYDIWHDLAKKYENVDTQFAAYLQAWKKASQINTLETYEKFLELRPNSMFNLMAIHQIFELVKAKNSIEEYAKFIEKFGERFPVAIEFIDAFNKIQELSFEKAKQINIIETFDEFIKTFPDAPHTKEAIELSFNLAKTKIEKELAEHPEQLEQIAKKLYGEARRIQDESGCQPKQYKTQTTECKYELFYPALRNYKLLKLPLFDSAESAIKMRDREEKIAFEDALLTQQKRIENSIHEMKTEIVNILHAQNQLLDKRFQELIDGQKDLKTTFETHQKIMKEQLTQLNQINVNLARERLNNTIALQTPIVQKHSFFSTLVNTGLNIIPYGGLIKTIIQTVRFISSIKK